MTTVDPAPLRDVRARARDRSVAVAAVSPRLACDLEPRRFLIVALMWSAMSLLGAVPFMLALDLSFYDAFFESASGYTTTGATVLEGLDTMAPSILFYRQEIQWLGGIGVIVLAVALLPMLGIGGMQLYKAETAGPLKDERFTPRLARTARNSVVVYAILTAACARWLLVRRHELVRRGRPQPVHALATAGFRRTMRASATSVACRSRSWRRCSR